MRLQVLRAVYVVQEVFLDLDKTSAFNVKLILSHLHLGFQHVNFAMYQPAIILGKGLPVASLWSITLF
jgi:hypothetical protein